MPNSRILVADDDSVVRDLFFRLLGAPNREVLLARSAADMESYFDAPPPDVVLLDRTLPDGDSMKLLPLLQARWPAAHIILVSGYASARAALESIRRGAYHHPDHRFTNGNRRRLAEPGGLRRKGRDPNGDQGSAAAPDSVSRPVARSAKMKDALRLAERVARTDVCVLLTGETGTGKEVMGRLLHDLSPRSSGPLVTVNCAALPRDLIEAELFGSVRGAFTGAIATRHGLLKEAAGGTLFLDEISEMPVSMQAKLLRVLQQKEFRKVGGTANERADCRIIAATNRPPEQAIAEGALRKDLYYRIGAITLPLPPLRERPDDILPLAQQFLQRFAVELSTFVRGFSSETCEVLRRYHWPGNVRQLEHEVQRLVMLTEDHTIQINELSPEIRKSPEVSLNSPLERAEREVIVATLRDCGGSKRAAARRLGIARQTLVNKLKHYGLEEPPDAPSSDQGNRFDPPGEN